jgi:hypothetical protein
MLMYFGILKTLFGCNAYQLHLEGKIKQNKINDLKQ